VNAAARRRLGRSPVEVTQLGFGAAPLGNLYRPVSEGDAREAVRSAWGAGIRYFDTAPLYGHGWSERRLGDALRRQPRGDLVLSTKVGRLLLPREPAAAERGVFAETLPFAPMFDYSFEGTWRSLEDSLQRLGMQRIDIAIIHDVSPRWHGADLDRRFGEAMDGAYRALDSLRSEGIIRAIGVGVNDADVCLRFAEAGDFDCFLLAGRYTLLDQSALDRLLPVCLDRGIGVVIGAPYGSGILATGSVPGATYFYQPASPEILERTRRLEAACARHGVPLAAAALQFPLGHPAVASVIPGLRSPAEVRASVEGLALPIPPALWQELRAEGLLHPLAPTPPAPARVGPVPE
jgi:D-threo-aldose 1-dehydrogenase